MSEQKPTFIVLPAETAHSTAHAGGDQDQAARIAQAIEQSIRAEEQARKAKEHKKPPVGPLKEIIFANKDSLYRYISWENPIRSLGSFFLALGVLVGAHKLPLTPWLLKSAATIFGVISITEGANRAFGPNTILSRLRPVEYKTIPEKTLNATLHDIHDLLQAAVVEIQRMLYGEDLSSAFMAFIGFTLTYWLLKITSPFSLAVLGLVSLYAAPLIWSPQGRKVAREFKQRTEELAQVAVEQSKTLAQDANVKASELVNATTEQSKALAQDARAKASEIAAKASNLAGNNTKDHADDHTKDHADDHTKDHADDHTSYNADNTYQLASGARDSASKPASSVTEMSKTATSKSGLGGSYATPRSAHEHLGSGISSLPGDRNRGEQPHNLGAEADVVVKPVSAADVVANRALEERARAQPLPATPIVEGI